MENLIINQEDEKIHEQEIIQKFICKEPGVGENDEELIYSEKSDKYINNISCNNQTTINKVENPDYDEKH